MLQGVFGVLVASDEGIQVVLKPGRRLDVLVDGVDEFIGPLGLHPVLQVEACEHAARLHVKGLAATAAAGAVGAEP